MPVEWKEDDEVSRLIVEAKNSWWIRGIEELDIDIEGVDVNRVIIVICDACYLEERKALSFETVDRFCKRHCPIFKLHDIFKERNEKVKVLCASNEGEAKKWYIQFAAGEVPRELEYYFGILDSYIL